MIETERLIFRKYTLEDIDFYASLLADPEVMRFIGKGITRTRKEAEENLPKLIKRYDTDKDGTGLLVAIRKSDKQPVGHIGLVPQTINGVIETELGYWIAREFWGQGYASEGAIAFADFGRNILLKKRLVSIIQHANSGSIGVAKKIGMNFEKDIEFNGQIVALYSLHKKGSRK